MIYPKTEFVLKNGLKVTLKTPEKADAEKLLSFIRTLAGQTDYLLSSPEDFQFSVEREESFLESFQNSKNWLIAVYDGDKVIADCNLDFYTHVKDRHRGSVGIGVEQSYWGMGIGSLLFDELIRLAKETEGMEQLELGVISANQRAKHLYEKKGFVSTGKIPRALKCKDGTYYDEELMTKFL